MSTKRKPNSGNPGKRAWVPLQRAERVPLKPEYEAAIRAQAGDQANALLEDLATTEMWRNDAYVVTVTRWSEGEHEGQVQELSIRRDDRKAVHDWRDFQRIKTEIAGANVEAVELYPAEDRLMDTANQYYLFCLPAGERLPMGYQGPRNVTSAASAHNVGATQRELPEDWQESNPQAS